MTARMLQNPSILNDKKQCKRRRPVLMAHSGHDGCTIDRQNVYTACIKTGFTLSYKVTTLYKVFVGGIYRKDKFIK